MATRTLTARFGLAAWLLGLALVAALSIVTFKLPGHHGDKLGHFMAYFGLTAVAFRLWPSGWRLWAAVALLLLFGAGMELIQFHIPTRQASWRDMAANAAGIASAVLLTRRVHGQPKAREPRCPLLDKGTLRG